MSEVFTAILLSIKISPAYKYAGATRKFQPEIHLTSTDAKRFGFSAPTRPSTIPLTPYKKIGG
jgi:hypothetical protein